MIGPDSDKPYPFENLPYELENLKRVVFLKHVITRKNISVGDYSYYDDPKGPERFEKENVLYHYDFSPEKLIIGKFVAIATDAKFIMGGANHKLDGLSTFPFGIFAHGWEKQMDVLSFPSKGDTLIKNDVWIGYGATIMPGITVGDGAIIAAKAVVTKDVEPYTTVGGNPAKILKKRLEKHIIQEMLQIKWWDWPIEKISRNIKLIIGCNIEALKTAR